MWRKMQKSDRSTRVLAVIVCISWLMGAPAMAADDKAKAPQPKVDRPSAEKKVSPPPSASIPAPPSVPFLPSERLSTGRSVSFPNDI